MKWVVVWAGILMLSMCGSTRSAAPPTGDEPTGATVAEESTTTSSFTTTSTSTTTTVPPSTMLPEGPPDLSGIWDATKIVGGKTEEGTVLISQAGSSFTLSFSDGFECRPADACEFDGTVSAISDPESGEMMYVWMASNSGRADDEGGTFETSFGIMSFSDTYPEGDSSELPATIDPSTKQEVDTSDFYIGLGQSVYRGGGQTMVWDGYLLLMPSG